MSLLESMGARIQSDAVHLKKDVSIPLAGTHKKLEPPSWLTREAPPACDQAGLQVWLSRLGLHHPQGNDGTNWPSFLPTIRESRFKMCTFTQDPFILGYS